MPILYVLTVLLLGASEPALHTHTFEDPIDAVSLQLPDRQVAMEVRGWAGTAWTQWYELEAEDEADPLMLESNLVLFPQTVHRIQVRGSDGYAMHPVRVSSVPPRYAVASISATAASTGCAAVSSSSSHKTTRWWPRWCVRVVSPLMPPWCTRTAVF